MSILVKGKKLDDRMALERSVSRSMSRSLKKNVLRNEDWNGNGSVHNNSTLPMIFKELSCTYGVPWCPYGVHTLSLRCLDQTDRNE